MLRVTLVALAGVLAFAAAPAAADVYEVRVPGVIAASDVAPAQNIVLSARYDVNRTVRWGGHGYTLAGLYGLPGDGVQFFRVESDGFVWTSTDEYLDGSPFFTSDSYSEADGAYQSDWLAGPAIVFDGFAVLGLAGGLAPQGGAFLHLGSDPGFGYLSTFVASDGTVDRSAFFAPATLSADFFYDPRGLYAVDPAAGAPRAGRWDFAGATVTVFESNSSVIALPTSPAPEPSTWVLAILGFGFVGAALRRRSAPATA